MNGGSKAQNRLEGDKYAKAFGDKARGYKRDH